MTTYNKDQEYTLKVVSTDNKVREIKYTPDKDMSKPEVIMALKAKYKNFFKLIESKLIESENTDIISKLNNLKDEFMSNLYKDKDKANEVKNQIKQVLQDAPDGTEMCRVVQDTSSGWTSHGSYSNTYTVIKTLKKENGVWEMYGRKKENLDDAVSSIVFNGGILMTRAEAEKEEERQKVNDTSSHRDIVNIGTDKWGNPIGKSTNRVDYPNKKEESYGETKYEVSSYYGKDFKGLEDSLNTNNYDEVETFIWEKLQNGNTVECTDTETGDRKRYSPETHEYGDETFGIEDYMVESKYDYNKVNKAMSGVEKILKQNGYNLTHDDINLETDNNGEVHVYDKLTGDEVLVVTQDMLRNILTEVTSNISVIVINNGRGTRFPDRETAIAYYKECVAGTDPDGAENYSYQNILYELMHTNKDVVYDFDDKTEYNWWISKGKPTEDISKELLKAHLGESIKMKKEDLSDKDIKELDKYTNNEIKKMYDKYCSENNNKKSFEEWQKENVDSALINELEYEFFSNRKKTEDLDVDEETFVNGFVGQPLSMVLTYIGDGHDIADKNYDSVVFFPPVDEIDDTDNYDLYVQGLSQVLKVAERFDVDDINIIVDIADYVRKNKDTLLDLFEVDGETDEEIMEDLVCRVMPSVISGYTTDNVYKLLLNTVRGGKEMKKEVLTLKKEDVSNINDKEISRLLSDKDFMDMLHITPEDVKKQIEISKKQFEEISDYVANYKGTFAELYKELGGWNLGYDNPEQDENNLFDCYYKSLLITVWVDEGVLKVSPHDVYIYAKDITDVDTDEILHLDFDEPIDFSKIKVTENRKSLGHKTGINIKKENKELLMEEDDLLSLKKYADKLKAYIDVNKNKPEMQTRQKELDGIIGKLWVALEDVPFIENEDRELILDGEYLDFPKGTERETIWHWFDGMYSKGVAYLINDFDENEKITENKTWEEISKEAEGTTFGQQALKVKDQARAEVEELLKQDGIDVDNLESVEDEIEEYCKNNNIKFDTHGNLVTECEKVTEDVVDDISANLQKEIRELSDADLVYKGICSLIAGYIEGMPSIYVDDEAMLKVNIDLVKEIADAVFDESNIWEPMDEFIFSEIYDKLSVD